MRNITLIKLISLISLLSLLMTACIGLEAAAHIPASTATPKATATISPADVVKPISTGDPASTLTAKMYTLDKDYLELQGTSAAKERSLRETEVAQNGILTAAQVAEIQARIEYSRSLTLLKVTGTQMVISASQTAQANLAAIEAARLADIHALSTDTAAKSTSAAAAQQTTDARLEISNNATATVDAAISTLAAPFTAAVESGRLAETLRRQKTGTALVQVLGWGALGLLGLFLLGVAIVTLIARWNPIAIAANQGTVMKDDDGNIWQITDGKWEPAEGAKAPAGTPPIRPFPPIYSAKNPSPVMVPPLNDTEKRALEILHKSNELYGKKDSRRLVGSLETGSGSMWDATIKALKAAGVEIATNNKGTYLIGVGVSRDELIYKIETGEVQLDD
ncbi:MAG: hypothetical protein C4575_13055 [Desulforudis sp.]|nr:MAG: hypothetical protein C4575_13055 [Desulforudis sp.]